MERSNRNRYSIRNHTNRLAQRIRTLNINIELPQRLWGIQRLRNRISRRGNQTSTTIHRPSNPHHNPGFGIPTGQTGGSGEALIQDAGLEEGDGEGVEQEVEDEERDGGDGDEFQSDDAEDDMRSVEGNIAIYSRGMVREMVNRLDGLIGEGMEVIDEVIRVLEILEEAERRGEEGEEEDEDEGEMGMERHEEGIEMRMNMDMMMRLSMDNDDGENEIEDDEYKGEDETEEDNDEPFQTPSALRDSNSSSSGSHFFRQQIERNQRFVIELIEPPTTIAPTRPTSPPPLTLSRQPTPEPTSPTSTPNPPFLDPNNPHRNAIELPRLPNFPPQSLEDQRRDALRTPRFYDFPGPSPSCRGPARYCKAAFGRETIKEPCFCRRCWDKRQDAYDDMVWERFYGGKKWKKRMRRMFSFRHYGVGKSFGMSKGLGIG